MLIYIHVSIYLPGGPVWPSLLSRSRRASGIFATRMSSTWGSIRHWSIRKGVNKKKSILSSDHPPHNPYMGQKKIDFFFIYQYFFRTSTQTRGTIRGIIDDLPYTSPLFNFSVPCHILSPSPCMCRVYRSTSMYPVYVYIMYY